VVKFDAVPYDKQVEELSMKATFGAFNMLVQFVAAVEPQPDDDEPPATKIVAEVEAPAESVIKITTVLGEPAEVKTPLL